MFSCEFCKIFKNTFCTEHLWATASENNKKTNLNIILYVNNVNVLVQVQLLHSFIYISCLVKKHITIYYCFCIKCITLCIGMCCSHSNFFASLIQNIPEFEAKKYFIDHQTANAIQLFVPTKRTFFGSLLFQNKLQQRGIPQKLLDKYSHLFICTSLRWTLSGGQKPVYTVKIVISE